MASPLPKTNKPAPAKYQTIVQRVTPDAGPANPKATAGQGAMTGTLPGARLGGPARTSIATTPHAMNTHTISDSAQAVTSALPADRSQIR